MLNPVKSLKNAFSQASLAGRYAVARTICSYDDAQCHRVSRLGLAFLSGSGTGLLLNAALESMNVSNPTIGVFAGAVVSALGTEVERLGQPGVRLRAWACRTRDEWQKAHPGVATPQPAA